MISNHFDHSGAERGVQPGPGGGGVVQVLMLILKRISCPSTLGQLLILGYR